MDIIAMFEQRLKYEDESIETVEENWDKRAETFYHNQIHGSTYYSDAVTRLLEQKGILTPLTNVLDIGAGSGRYAIPFAKKCQSVLALDVSSEMLQFLQQEKKKHHLKNIHTIKSAWPTTEAIGDVDVIFAAMCPATRSVEALKEMSKTANNYGVICQFTASTDNVIEALKEQQVTDGHIKGPHNNRNLLQSYFNILWELGYHPEISYLDDTFEVKLTFEDALESYKKRFEQVEVEQLESVLRTIQGDADEITIMKNTTLAVISWETTVKK